MTNLFAWEFGALLVGIILYSVSIWWVWERDDLAFALWAILSGLIIAWVIIVFCSGLSADPPIADIFIGVCLGVLALIHITAVIMWLLTEP